MDKLLATMVLEAQISLPWPAMLAVVGAHPQILHTKLSTVCAPSVHSVRRQRSASRPASTPTPSPFISVPSSTQKWSNSVPRERPSVDGNHERRRGHVRVGPKLIYTDSDSAARRLAGRSRADEGIG
ncbi:hypothetical protein DFH06DRAFT_1335299 [Mycena polygramma]|nr:hypothetical protein DFH06DRAFT_1335299 [Mycena polygramma]